MEILRALKYDASKFSVNLICRVPVGNEFVASHIEDDKIDSLALVGHTVVELERRWLSWPDCYDDLLWTHLLPNIVYCDPFDYLFMSKFCMGQA
ncbi:hypothetical protein IEQ34_000795 [Dendrobium chrysotoxum]|uniref:Uncharacterized protein n=1 Tax=Dendrobium chrysotoxum TaxID=161865 RepID=A0AAV7HQM5_DENCH|nr:hypothetical protein IEQ34_000795 [Dendrobium chrysotoxum]